jgi:eukaryotic-like serine/threonine-protein kinase
MSMEEPAWNEVERVFLEVVGLSGEAREHAVDRLCGSDEVLRRAVERLLAADGSDAAGRVDRGVVGVGLGLDREPDHIGAYRILRRIGSGGMGVVYEAEQERPARRVAVKVLRPEYVGRAAAARMAFEGELLGRLSHPGVATVFEAGVWEEGGLTRPFVAMELVEGRPITEFAEERGLSREERVGLVASVCDAVHHAHLRGVIHRDLKPGNILVCADGQAKIVDFGIARVTDGVADAGITQTGQILGTLEYMAPERLSGGASSDARADIYSLGVVLFQLLSGRLPHELSGVASGSFTDVIRRMTEMDAPLLGGIDVSLRGDIEIVVATALSRDPARRYASAAAMADDLRRLLADLPILARRPSTVYQVRKFARRNRGLVVAVGVLVLGVCAGIAGMVVGFGEAVKQRQRAEQRAEDARLALETAESERARAEQQKRMVEAISGFVNMDLLGQAARERMGRDVTVKQAVDAAATTLDDRFPDALEVRAAIRNSVAGIYDSLSEYEVAEAQYLRAIEEFGRSMGEDAELTHLARQDLGRMYRRLSRLEDAAAIMVPLYEEFRGRYGPKDERTLRALIDMAQVNADMGGFDLAFELLDRFDADRAGVFDDGSSVAMRALEARGMNHFQLRQFEQAAEAFARVAEFRERDPQNPNDELTPLANLAASYEGLGRYDEAEPIYRKVLAIETAIGGPDNLETLATAHNLAFLLESMGRHEESEPIYRDTLERCARVLGPSHEGTLSCMTGLASLLRDTDRNEEAKEILEEAWGLAVAAYGVDSPLSSYVGGNLGLVCGEVGEDARAVEVLGPVIATTGQMLGPEHPRVAQLLLGSGRSKWRVGMKAEGRAEVVRARDALAAAEGEDSPSVARADSLLSQIDAASEQGGVSE